MTYEDPPDGIGRMLIKPKIKEGETMHTQATLKREFKGAICEAFYTDIDIKSCHPTLLINILNDRKIPCPLLTQYVEDTAIVEQESGVDHDTFKTMMFETVMYNPTCTDEAAARKWKAAGGTEPKLFRDLRAEISAAATKLLDENVCYLAEAERRKGKDYPVLYGCALSLLIQTQEKVVIRSLYDFMKKQNVTVGAIIHDGLHIDKYKDDRLARLADKKMLLISAQGYIFNDTGHTVHLAYKDWQLHPAYSQTVNAATPVDAAMHVLEKLKGRLYRCQEELWIRDDDFQWRSGDKVVARILSNLISFMRLYVDKVYASHQPGYLRDITQLALNMAPDNPTFVSDMHLKTRRKLTFSNGYYDFDKREFVSEQIDSLARVAIDFPKRVKADIDEVRRRIMAPIMGDTERYMLNWLARGLAGEVADKDWSVWIGARDSGKSVLTGLLEHAFGPEIVAIINAEVLLFKANNDDPAKALGWMQQCAHARLVMSNECTIDAERPQALNGALIKKFSSGGDSCTARCLYKDAVTFRLSGRLMLAGNDFPSIKPTDATETLTSFEAPRKFVKSTDDRLKDPSKYAARDEGIKAFCQQPRVRAAVIHLLLEAYGAPLRCTSMDAMKKDYNAEGDDRERFFATWEVTGDPQDKVPVSELQSFVRREKLAVTSRAYNIWMRSQGCDTTARCTTTGGQRVRCVTGLKRKCPEEETDLFAGQPVAKQRTH